MVREAGTKSGEYLHFGAKEERRNTAVCLGTSQDEAFQDTKDCKAIHVMKARAGMTNGEIGSADSFCPGGNDRKAKPFLQRGTAFWGVTLSPRGLRKA
jgi:hypothetical protein